MTKSIMGPKVFGIGLSKTGTTSLGECFEILGLTPCAHPQTVHDCLAGEQAQAQCFKSYLKAAQFANKHQDFGEFPHRALVEQVLAYKNYSLAVELAQYFRSFEDRPWNILPLIPVLDETFPDSRFILTWREPDRWWRSVENWLLRTHPEDEGKRWRYFMQLGVEKIEREAFITAYNAHNAAVRSYFAGREDFLAINFEAEEGWEELCTFLGVETPKVPLPHCNQQHYSALNAGTPYRQR